jgi:hypothetical protein
MVGQTHGRQPREARQRRSSASAGDIVMSAVLYEQELRDTGMCFAIVGSATLIDGQVDEGVGCLFARACYCTQDIRTS